MENNDGSKFFYFLAGMGIGALVGVLFAPQSGDETRDIIAGKAEQSREYLLRKSRELREQATEYVDKGKDLLAEQRQHLAAAVEAGKQAYRSEAQPPNL
ncbi:MAG: YtxH domain-containing protein [Acidobacteria bacterium]|nr:YtxH domain-containing protein [Acidobacteriota bacterium]